MEINVSKCEYRGGVECHIRDYPILNCADVKDCYYKQLQQLKVENEDLKQECDLYKTWYRAKHDDLKNFLGQLKAENKSYEYQLEKRIEICDIWIDVANKYKQCLDDIEEMVNKYDITNPNTIISNPLEELCQILIKIKKVKEGE